LSSTSTSEPTCPKCRRRLAAWKLNHCIYCGEVFPPDFKAGFAEPESLKWVERPAIPAAAAKQLEMMKVVPMEGRRRNRGVALFGLFSIPIFAGIFYLMYRIVDRRSGAAAILILLAGAAFLGYLGWAAFKRSS
jgi:hypothetical protein